MEAIELHREETAKMREHRAICRAAGKEVSASVRLHAYLRVYKKDSYRGHFWLK